LFIFFLQQEFLIFLDAYFVLINRWKKTGINRKNLVFEGLALGMGVDFRSRHFAFPGAALSLLAVPPAGSQLCRCNPAGVFVPSTVINWFL
jgi:hypothetical protein